MTPSKFLCLTTIVVAITIADTKSISTNLQTAKAIQLNSNTNQSIDLKVCLNEMRSKYTPTLLNETIVPFLNNCTFVYAQITSPALTHSTLPSTATSSILLKPGDENLLCLIYYDMMYNLGRSGFNDYQIESNVIDTLKSYDNDTITTNFCTLFDAEIPTEAAERPFETKLSPNNKTSSDIFKNAHTCSVLCYEVDENYASKIKPVCKLISGGYRALHRHLIDHDEVPQKPTITKIVDTPLEAIVGSINIDDVKQAVPIVPPISVESVNNVASVSVVPVVPVQAIAVVSTSAPIVVLPAIKSVIEPVAEGINPQASPNKLTSNVVNINLDSSKPSTPNLVMSSAPAANQTSENGAVPLASDKAYTKEMKPTPKDIIPDIVVPAEPNEESADKNDVPIGDEEEANEYPYDQDKTEKESVIMSIDPKNISSDPDEDGNMEDEDSLLKAKIGEPDAQQEPQLDNTINNMRSDKQHIPVAEQHSYKDNAAEIIDNDPFFQDEDSNFFSYFMCALLVCAAVYIVYHNKQKVMALVVEGRRSRSNSARGGRRKHRAAYRKLDSNLEEAIQSSGKVSSSPVIY